MGEKGELAFLKKYPDIVRTSGRKGDFIGFTKKLIELKTDTRSIDATPNFFIERFSSLAREAPGGPWQSSEHGVYYFVYLFVKEGVIYWFELDKLLQHLEANEKEYQKRYIRNVAWTALGYLVPRSSLEHLIVKKEYIYEGL